MKRWWKDRSRTSRRTTGSQVWPELEARANQAAQETTPLTKHEILAVCRREGLMAGVRVCLNAFRKKQRVTLQPSLGRLSSQASRSLPGSPASSPKSVCQLAKIARECRVPRSARERAAVGALPWRIGGRAQGVRAQGGGNSTPCGPTVGAPRNDPNKSRGCADQGALAILAHPPRCLGHTHLRPRASVPTVPGFLAHPPAAACQRANRARIFGSESCADPGGGRGQGTPAPSSLELASDGLGLSVRRVWFRTNGWKPPSIGWKHA